MGDPNCQRRGKRRKHFTEIKVMQRSEAKGTMNAGWLQNARRIPVPAGGLLLWSSRATHQGWSGGPRLAQPVCWEPRERRVEEARIRKLALAALGLPSTHWASLGQPHHLVSNNLPLLQAGRDGSGGSIEESIVFPLKATIRSRALKDDIDTMVVWKELAGVNLHRPLSSSHALVSNHCIAIVATTTTKTENMGSFTL